MRAQSITQTAGAFETLNIPAAKKSGILLWSLQGVLALLFIFAGVAKLAMPTEVLASMTGLPGLFMRFISVAEIAGALGLVLPGILHLRPYLTPLAASGLVIIMIGAVTMTIIKQGVAPALFPFVVGNLLVVVIRKRLQR